MRRQLLLTLPFLFAGLTAQARPCTSRAACADLNAQVLNSRALRAVADPMLQRLIAAGRAEAAYDRALDLLEFSATQLTGERPAPATLTARLERLLEAESSPFDALINRVADHLCDAGCRAQAERLVRQSGLLQRELINEGLAAEALPDAVHAWVTASAEPADSVVDRAAWIIVAEDRFKAATGLNDTMRRADLEAAALMLSGGATVAIDVAQPTCTADGLEGPDDLFSGCGMPDAPQLPDLGGAGPDPVPTARSARQAPAQRRMPQRVGAWDMPGACYGLDPRKLFDGASQQAPPSEEAPQRPADEPTKEPAPTPSKTTKEPPRLPSIMDKKPAKTAPPPSERPPEVSSETKEAGKALLAAYEATKIPIGGGATLDLLDSLGNSGKSVISGQPMLTINVSFRPAHDADVMNSVCGERFAATMAGCLGANDEGAARAGNRPFDLICGDSLAPVLTTDPQPAGCGCIGESGEGGADEGGEGGAGQDGTDNEDDGDVGAMDCCPTYCFVATNNGYDASGFGACHACAVGPECGGADANAGGLVEACAAGLGEPIHSQLCGAVDPSPLQVWFGEPAMRIAEPVQRRAP